MKYFTTSQDEQWKVLGGSERSQAAIMTLPAGDSVGGPDNRHEGSDQWLFVLSGRGEAVVAGKKLLLEKGTLVLVEAGEGHEVRNTGDEPMKTLDFYAPPEY